MLGLITGGWEENTRGREANIVQDKWPFIE